jgi:hypothetical protein
LLLLHFSEQPKRLFSMDAVITEVVDAPVGDHLHIVSRVHHLPLPNLDRLKRRDVVKKVISEVRIRHTQSCRYLSFRKERGRCHGFSFYTLMPWHIVFTSFVQVLQQKLVSAG